MDNIVAKRDPLTTDQIESYYLKHRDSLRKDTTQRQLNGSMAAAPLPIFEARPDHWEAIRWLNAKPAPKGMSFPDYLKKWHRSVPQKHKAFVKKISHLYGVRI